MKLSLVRRVLLQLAQGTVPDEFLPKLRAQITPGRVKQIAGTLNSLNLPVAIVHTAELIERRDENGL